MAKKGQKKGNGEYNVPSRCHVCGKEFMARYNVAARAKTCTPKSHKCRKGTTKNGRRTSCLDGCCRSKYYRGLSSAATDVAIDPRFILSDQEFDQMWKASKKLGDPEGITIRFIASTGCRLEESSLVYPAHLDWETGKFSSVTVTTIKRSGRPPRQVHIFNNSEFARELRKWSKDAAPNEPLFPVARRTLQRVFEKILEPIKPDRASLVHILRHTRASQLIAEGAKWNYVGEQLGWASLETAKRYDRVDKNHIAKVLGRLV